MIKKKSKILEMVHETAKGMYAAGAIDKVTMREYDQLCIPPLEPLKPKEIKGIREKAHVSQAVFAAYLHTSPVTVQKWERGDKHPSGPAQILLRLVGKKGLEAIAV